MKTYMRILAAAFAVLLAVTLTTAGEDGSRSNSFKVSKGGILEVSTSRGDIHVSTWEKNEVSFVVEGLDDEDLDKVKTNKTGNTVRISYRSRWNNGSGHVRFSISVPSQFNLDIEYIRR